MVLYGLEKMLVKHKKSGLLWLGERRARGFSPLGLRRGPEGAGRSGAEGFLFGRCNLSGKRDRSGGFTRSRRGLGIYVVFQASAISQNQLEDCQIS